MNPKQLRENDDSAVHTVLALTPGGPIRSCQSSGCVTAPDYHNHCISKWLLRLLFFTVMSNGILIVDDNANIRRLLRSFVEGNTAFAVCGEAENGAEAIEKAKELQPDLILLDLGLPGMSGTDAASFLKRIVPHVKIILFTMHTEGINQALASRFDIDLVLTKSDSITSLKEHLVALLTPSPTPTTDLRKNTRIN
jgi:CheY-like chemotaxis protein